MQSYVVFVLHRLSLVAGSGGLHPSIFVAGISFCYFILLLFSFLYVTIFFCRCFILLLFLYIVKMREYVSTSVMHLRIVSHETEHNCLCTCILFAIPCTSSILILNKFDINCPKISKTFFCCYFLIFYDVVKFVNAIHIYDHGCPS